MEKGDVMYDTEHNPFGRPVSLIINPFGEVCSTTDGPDHEKTADLIAEEWNEMLLDLGEAGA